MARLGFNAGVDMDMEGHVFMKYLPELVQKGVVPIERIDAAASAILRAKAALGLLDDPYRYSDEAREKQAMLRPESLAADPTGDFP